MAGILRISNTIRKGGIVYPIAKAGLTKQTVQFVSRPISLRRYVQSYYKYTDHVMFIYF